MNTSPLTPKEIAERLDTILTSILMLVAARFRIIGAITAPLWNRISRSRQLLARLLAHIAAARPLRIRTARIRPARPPVDAAAAARLGGAAVIDLPRRPMWLVIKLGYEAAGFGSQLNHLLQTPGVAEILATSPGAARTLRPLCRILGIDLPPALQLPPRPRKPRARKSRAAKPRQPAPTPHPARNEPGWSPNLPLRPQRKPRPMPFLPPMRDFRRTKPA